MSRKVVIVVSILTIYSALFILFNHRNSIINTSPEYVFLYAENQPEGYPTTLGAQYFANLVYERTDGRIEIVVKHSGELGVEKDIISQLKYGGVDFARVSLSQLAQVIPSMNVLQMPYLYNDSGHMWKVLDGKIGDAFLESTKTEGVIGLSWYDAGARNFYTAGKQIKCLEDMKGLNIRVQESNLMADMVNAMGAIPMKIEYEDVYSSIERGIVNGAENNWSSYIYMNHSEVAAFYTVDEHTRVPELQLMSAHTFDKLALEDRNIIKECAKESALYQRQLWKDQENECKKQAKEKGIQIYELTIEEKKEFQHAMQPVYEKYCKENYDLIEQIKNIQ